MKPAKCIGLWGRLKGHRFIFGGWMADRSYLTDHCLRCGMPTGGWR